MSPKTHDQFEGKINGSSVSQVSPFKYWALQGKKSMPTPEAGA